MVAALADIGAEWLTADGIAGFVSKHDLYRSPEGRSTPRDWQIALRARKYVRLFEGSDSQFSRIRLRVANL
jgi:hypothetical protein